MSDETVDLALDTIQKKKQALVFAPSRMSAEKTAEEISKKIKINLPELSQKILKAVSSPTKQCRRLSHCVNKGIAFHHAGLTQKQKELIESEFREGNIKIICSTPTLCLSGDTLIWQPEGKTSVKNFKNSNLFVLSQNKLLVMKAKNVYKNKNSKKLIKITSVSNHSIKLTPNHKIFVKRNNIKQLIPASKCKIKDKIATVGKLKVEQIIKPKISNFVIDNELPIEDKELNEEDFYFIGSMLGDGHSGIETRDQKLFYKGSPNFTSGDLESIELIEMISKSFDKFSKIRKRTGCNILILTKKKWFREFLCRCGIEIGKNKYISPSLIQADLNLIKSLIQGLFDTDGYVQTGVNIGFSNISFKLIRDIQKSLLRFGIVSRIRKRPGKELFIIKKIYKIKDSYELTINQRRSIFLFHELVGFRLKRKQDALDKLIEKISHVLYSECKSCNYKIYADVFSGRSQQHKSWGNKKRRVIELLGKEGELGSKIIQKKLGFLPRHPKGNRLNHHYELIVKRRIGSRSNTEWFWSLKPIGSWIYWKILKDNKELFEFFKLNECPLCQNRLNKKLRKKWRDSDIDGDIFWDYVRNVKEVEVEEDVYDVVLPDNPKNEHMFVANGFIVHNSAGVSMPAFRVIIKNLKRYSGRWGMDWIPVLEYYQMAGRAGRPEFEAYGEAIVVAKNESDKKEIHERYVCGQPEDIYSKLAVEPVFRTYLLSLIASGITNSRGEIVKFFSKTFWAHQFKDMDKIEMMIDQMIDLLDGYGFIKVSEGNLMSRESKIQEDIMVHCNEEKSTKKTEFISAGDLGQKNDNQIRATLIGKRVSELYLDPLTANYLIECMRNTSKVKLSAFSFLQMISHTLELFPPLRIKVREHDEIQERLVEKYDQLLESEPDVYDVDYGDFMNSIKTALFFESWIDEQEEDFLLENYGVRPGEIYAKLDTADWLLYSSSELARLMQFQPLLKELNKLRVRVKNGVREELLTLLKLKGIGRKRARKLFNNGFKDLGDLKKADTDVLGQLIGKLIAVDVKKQLGEEVTEVSERKRKGQLGLGKYS